MDRMTAWIAIAAACAAAGAALVGCQGDSGMGTAPRAGEELSLRDGGPAPTTLDPGAYPVVQAELGRARAATERYRNLEAALADGYEDIDVYMPNMGHHYMKPELLDAEFEVERPELLVYADLGFREGLRLIAVEYAVPLSLSEDPPEGFTGEADVWDANETFQIWTLHAWVWQRNPDGVFAPMNPQVP